MEASSELLKMIYIQKLDTVAKQDSCLVKLWDNIRTISDKTYLAATKLNPELIREEFLPMKNSSLNILANFKLGWSLTGHQFYFIFSNPDILNVQNFKDNVVWINGPNSTVPLNR